MHATNSLFIILEKLDTAKQEYRVIADQIGQSYDLAAY